MNNKSLGRPKAVSFEIIPCLVFPGMWYGSFRWGDSPQDWKYVCETIPFKSIGAAKRDCFRLANRLGLKLPPSKVRG